MARPRQQSCICLKGCGGPNSVPLGDGGRSGKMPTAISVHRTSTIHEWRREWREKVARASKQWVNREPFQPFPSSSAWQKCRQISKMANWHARPVRFIVEECLVRGKKGLCEKLESDEAVILLITFGQAPL